jgi:hypothetical protein
MAVSNQPIFPVVIQTSAQTWVAADTTTLKTLVTAGANGTKIESLIITSTDTASRDLQFWLNDGTNSYLLGTVNAPISAGNTNAIPSVAAFLTTQLPVLPYDSNSNRYLYLKAGWTLKAGALVAVTAAKTVYAIAQFTDF